MIHSAHARWVGHFILILLCAAALPLHAESKVQELKGEHLKPFIERMRSNLQAWSFHKDDPVFDEAGSDYSKRPDALFRDTSLPLEGFRGWQEYQHVIKSWLAHGIDQADIELVDEEAFMGWRYKDVVWNLMHCKVSLVMSNGDRPQQQCRGTSVWEWEGDRWRLVHETFSVPVTFEAPVYQGERPDDPRVEPYLELMDLAGQMAQAWGAGPVDSLPQRLQKFYLKSENLSIYTPWYPLVVYRGWDAFRSGVKNHIAPQVAHIAIRLNDDLEAHRRGRLAWSHATLHVETRTTDGTITPGDARQTLIWYLTEDGWRVIHEHFSFPGS